MKKKVVIISTVVLVIIATFLVFDYFHTVYQREHRSVSIPTGTVQYFDMESERAIRIFEARSNSMQKLSESDKEFIGEFLGKYVGNPRLSDEQDTICINISLLDVFYSSYLENKDSNKTKKIKEANESIESFFSVLKRMKNTQ